LKNIVKKEDISQKWAGCPVCNAKCPRRQRDWRKVKDTCHIVWSFRISKHYCEDCDKHFSIIPNICSRKNQLFSDAAEKAIKATIAKYNHTLEWLSAEIDHRHGVTVCPKTLHDWRARMAVAGELKQIMPKAFKYRGGKPKKISDDWFE